MQQTHRERQQHHDNQIEETGRARFHCGRSQTKVTNTRARLPIKLRTCSPEVQVGYPFVAVGQGCRRHSNELDLIF